MFDKLFAYSVLWCGYSMTLLAARVLRQRSRRRGPKTRRIAVVGTFHNDNWFLSHTQPLVLSRVGQVIVVTDQAVPAPDAVRVICPSRWAARLLGRALSKMIWLTAVGARFRPDVYVGFHLFPGAVTALLAARLFGRPACYQMTGGPIEILGGGAYNENTLMSKLGRPSALLQRLALAIVREFDLVVVRGSKAKAFLAHHEVRGDVEIITGSVNDAFFTSTSRRILDLVFVGRLSEIKQPLQFIEIVAELVVRRKTVRATLVGDGALRNAVRARARSLGIEEHITFMGKARNVEAVLARSRVFVLTSRSEGLSIALAEAMAAGVVPVVADVGDLADIVHDGTNGFLVRPNDVASFVARIHRLLDDTALWQQCSQAARQTVRRRYQVGQVARRWRACLQRLLESDRSVAA